MGDRPRNDECPAAAPIVAARDLPADRGEVFGLLDDLDNHDWIGGNWLDVVDVHRKNALTTGADLVLRRPFAPDRTATTIIEQRRHPDRLAGTVEVHGAATARLEWHLSRVDAGGTRVRLTITPLALRTRDRLWLAAGGRRWILARTTAMLDRLAARLAEP